MRNFLLALSVFSLSLFTLHANAGKMPPGFLVGTWSLEGKKKCSDPNLEYVEFHADGTYKSGHNGRVELVGFWRMHSRDDDIEFHVVTSLAFFGEEFAQYEGQFEYLNLSAVPTDISENEFKGVTTAGDDLERFTASRCKNKK